MDIKVTVATKKFISQLEVIEKMESVIAPAAKQLREELLDEDLWTLGDTLVLEMYYEEDSCDNDYHLGFLDPNGIWWDHNQDYCYTEGCTLWSVLLLVDQMLKD